MGRNIFKILSLLALFGIAPALFAETVVTNQVVSSASTGGNRAGSETIMTGESATKISIETTINGELVTDIEKSASSRDGTPVQLEAEAIYRGSAEDDAATADAVSQNDPVDLPATDSTPPTPAINKFFTWLINIFKNAFSIFA